MFVCEPYEPSGPVYGHKNFSWKWVDKAMRFGGRMRSRPIAVLLCVSCLPILLIRACMRHSGTLFHPFNFSVFFTTFSPVSGKWKHVIFPTNALIITLSQNEWLSHLLRVCMAIIWPR